ncbi:MAG TPA: hypothetical protein VJ866_10305 [Pyrinomonadaceae bacterium]|nr:hypothetical protein [Pyrinomonadaceae bacterium]
MPRAEIILLQFDIAGHSKIDIPTKNLQKARKRLQQYISALVSVQRHAQVSWAGDGGWCWFKVAENDDFSLATDAAVDILEILPRINEALQREGTIKEPLSIRLSADSMNVELDDDPAHFAAPQMNKFLKYEREVGLVNSLVITQRIYDQLQFGFQSRFKRWRRSPELETSLYVYDGVRRRNAALAQLKNRGPHPDDIPPAFVRATAFEEERYLDMCWHAYSDLVLDVELDNVESVRFLAFRNALANTMIKYAERADIPELSRLPEDEKLISIAGFPYEILQHVRRHDFRFGQAQTPETRGQNVGQSNPVSDALQWCNSESQLTGGESLYFFNASALGFIAEIGESTLLDHVSAGNLKIVSVIGGVRGPERGQPDNLIFR